MITKITLQNDRLIKISKLKRGDKFIVDWATRDSEKIFVCAGVTDLDPSCGLITAICMTTGEIACFHGYETVSLVEITDITITGIVR
ncbi:MAG TPA: hypothetical protein PLK08_05555 [Phycisphaerae bacterium]|nr:hypothetical protein [Phycisphaerae bacterium]